MDNEPYLRKEESTNNIPDQQPQDYRPLDCTSLPGKYEYKEDEVGHHKMHCYPRDEDIPIHYLNIGPTTWFVETKMLDDRAQLPKKAHDNDAAFDLFALEDTVLVPFQVNRVRTGIAVKIPEGFKGEVYTRSGYGARGIFVVNSPGKVDENYRQELFVLLIYIPQDFAKTFSSLVNSLIVFAAKGSCHTSDIELINTLRNTKLPEYKITAGDRIAQFEIQSVEKVQFNKVDKLDETERTGGIGSSGV